MRFRSWYLVRLIHAVLRAIGVRVWAAFIAFSIGLAGFVVLAVLASVAGAEIGRGQSPVLGFLISGSMLGAIACYRAVLPRLLGVSRTAQPAPRPSPVARPRVGAAPSGRRTRVRHRWSSGSVRTVVLTVEFLAMTLAFAFCCGASAILAVFVGLEAAGHRERIGPPGSFACAGLLGLSLGLAYWLTRMIRALDRSTREPIPPPPAPPRTSPLWDRDLDFG